MTVSVNGGVILALLGLIATIDLAQFALQIRHEKRLSRLEIVAGSKTITRGGEDDN